MLLAIALLAIMPANAGVVAATDDIGKTTIHIEMIDGERKPLIPETKVQLALFNEHGQLIYESRESYSDSSIAIELNLEASETYHVVARTTSYRQAISRGFMSDSTIPIELKLLFMPRHARPVFIRSDFKTLQENNDMWRVLFYGQEEQTAEIRYEALRQDKPLSLAGYFSIATTVMAYQTPEGDNLFQYYKEIDWPVLNETQLAIWRGSGIQSGEIKYTSLFDNHRHGDRQRGLENDRFFAWVSTDIVPVIEHLSEIGEFKREICPRLWGHPGATRSFKLVKYQKGNFQITLHENRTKEIDGVRCILVETDVDYFSQLWRHALQEVLPHKLFRGLTNPRKVYVIEWQELQSAGSNFAPPYGWTSKNQKR